MTKIVKAHIAPYDNGYCGPVKNLTPFTPLHLSMLTKGEKFKAGSILDGVTDKQITWEMVERLAGGKAIKLRARLFGIDLGLYTANLVSGSKVKLVAAK